MYGSLLFLAWGIFFKSVSLKGFMLVMGTSILLFVTAKIEEKETQPPKRYSPASIISELEKRNLGTKATRSSILETLYDRGYVKEKSIEATPLGISLIETLEKRFI